MGTQDRLTGLSDLRARDLMTPNVITVGEDWLIDRLAEFLVDRGITGAPVVSDEGKLIGVVSMTDLARFQSLPVGEVHDGAHNYFQPAQEFQLASEEFSGFHVDTESLVTVRDIMTPTVFSIGEDADIQQVVETMIRGRIHRLLVTRESEVVGIVSAFDILRAVAGQIGP